ncbi:uncharacterized protein LOC128955701 [Oppia nitens]|uniref:uncharacterized protein LOC128955701 n=1 Tax=Oppia nitens TaxID=1686743 RepID=UPI0023DBBE80|nr:uncharacterized protein LOC128955701 [Oppia nitens]
MDEKIAIAWCDLTYKVKSLWTKRPKIILNDVNGYVSFGTLNALMGPSGAGKTTLLKCINGQINSAGLSHRSKIYMSSGEKIRACLIGQNQNEQLVLGLTARQNLLYASKLKNSDNDFFVDHEKNVNQLLFELMTRTDIADTRVENCSGGEQRRLTIALELTSYIKPNLICIDEPTSGLDSNAAEMVIEYLRLLSRKHNISIITSIHQPNTDALLMFDKLYVLAKGGVCVYFGPPRQLEHHLNQCQIQCQEHQVPIEVTLKVATRGADNRQVIKLAKKAQEDNRLVLHQKCKIDTKLSPNGIPFESKCFNMLDVWYLLLRTMRHTYLSHWKTLFIQLLFYIFCPLLIAKTVNYNIGRPDGCLEYTFRTNQSCFNQLTDDSLLDQNLKYQAFTSVLVMFIQICTTTLTFTADVKIFMGEHRNKWYSTGSYYMAKNIVELIPTIIFSINYAFINYYISGQLFDMTRIFLYTFIIIFGMLCSQGFGYLVGIICIKSEQLAIGVSIGLYLMLCMFCNIFTPLNEMPQIFLIISDISFNKFVFYSVLIIIYGFDRCPKGQLSIVMHKYTMVDDLFYIYAKYLVIYAISLRILAFIVLYFKVNTFVNRSLLVRLQKYVRKLQCFHSYIINGSEPELLKVRKISTVSNKSVYVIDNDIIGQLDTTELNPMDHKLCIAWMDLTLKNQKQFFMTKEKTILRQLNGFVEIGTMTALMGPSGAGKTSLLKCLNGRYQSLMTDDTKIYLSKHRKIKTCFISQDVREHLISGLTAEQTLLYASKLKNSDTKQMDHLTSIKNLMVDLLISDIANSNAQNCSTGEQKRLVMAMELTSVNKPNLICIDEPTTGLDSNAAEVVMKCLKNMSRKHNISIITSIHQPNSDVLMMFDKLYVLANGGVCVYSGRPQLLKQHLNACDVQCSDIQVPIELLLKHACNGYEDQTVAKMMARTESDKQVLSNRCRTETLLAADGIVTKSKRFALIDFWFLLSRIITYTYRYNWKLILMKIVATLVFGYSLTLFFPKNIGQPTGCVNFQYDYPNTCDKSVQKLEEESLLSQNISYNFLVILLITFVQIVVTTMTFTSDVKIFLNEHRNGWYSTGCYYWAKCIEELIPTIITLFLYIYIIDIYEGTRIFVFYLYFLTIGILCIQSFGHLIGIIFSDNQKIAVLFSVALYLLLFLLSNYFVPINELHYAIQWFSNLSTFKLLFECILILFYGFNRCSGNEFSSVMFVFGFQDQQFYSNIKILVCKLIVLRVLALIVLLIKVNLRPKRHIEFDVNP